MRHRQQIGTGGDAAAALVNDGLRVAAGQQGLEFLTQGGGGFVEAVGAEVAGVEAVDVAG